MSAVGSVIVQVPTEPLLLPPPSPELKVTPLLLPAPLDDEPPPLEDAPPPLLELAPPVSPNPLPFVPLEHAAATSPNETRARRPARMRGR
jgi:hypothetical protein